MTPVAVIIHAVALLITIRLNINKYSDALFTPNPSAHITNHEYKWCQALFSMQRHEPPLLT